MSTERVILCLDLDAFYASVEELLHPEWRGLPILVGGKPEQRGVVSSCSYAARKFGVRSAMPMSRALQLCPQAIVTPPRFDIYHQHSRRVMSIIHEYGCPVEQVSVDEVFVDATDAIRAWGNALALASDMKRRIRDEAGLPCTIGVAANKLVAKIASNRGKPDGLLEVQPGEEVPFLAPLPIGQLWGVGPKTAARLEALGIRTIGDLQDAPLARLEPDFGLWATDLQRKARGHDVSRVVTEHAQKSVSRETTFAKDIGDVKELKRVLLALSEKVAHDLRADGLQAGTVAIKLRWANFDTITRQTTLKHATDSATDIYQAASALLTAALTRRAKVRLLGVRAAHLVEGAQLSLFDASSDEKRARLHEAVDAIREKYGDESLKRGALVRRKPAPDRPAKGDET